MKEYSDYKTNLTRSSPERLNTGGNGTSLKRAADTIIVELTGMTGVGKTTFFKQFRGRVEDEIALFSDELVLESYGLNFISKSLSRRAAMDILLMLLLLRHSNKYRCFIRYIFAIGTSCREKISLRLNIVRNVILKCARFVFIKERLKKQIVIVDEGISHVPFNMIDRAAKDNLTTEDILQIFGLCSEQLAHVNVVILQREHDSILKTLAVRGHKRLSNGSLYSLEQFSYYNALILKAYKEVPDHIFASKHYLELDAEYDLKAFLKQLGNGGIK